MEEKERDSVQTLLEHMKQNYLDQTYRSEWRKSSNTKCIYDVLVALATEIKELKKELNQ